MIKADNYVSIQGWMVTDLKLHGNDLIVYAIIYGFTQDLEHWFEGSISYMAEWCNCTKRGIYKNIDNLIKMDLIEKEDFILNGIKHCKYRVTDIWSSEQSSLGSEQSSLNNIDNNIDNKKYKNNIEVSNGVASHSKSKQKELVADKKDCVDIFKKLYLEHCPSGANFREPFATKRVNKIKYLFKTYDRQTIIECLDKAEQSAFLKRVGKVSISWIIEPENFNKILEGNYDKDYTQKSASKKSIESRYNSGMSKGKYDTERIIG